MIIFKRLFQYGCYATFAVCIIYLTLLSLFSTSAPSLKKVTAEGEIPRWESYNYFLPDSPWKHLLAAFLFIIFLTVIFYFFNSHQVNGRLSWLCVILFIACIFFIFKADLFPVSDSGKVLNIARQMKAHNFEQFAVEGYMYRYPDQAGIVLIYYLIHCIFGEKDYLVIQIINAALIAVAYYLMGKASYLLWGKKDGNVQRLTVLLCVIFFPAALYVTLAYGTIPGFALGVMAFYFQLKFLNAGRFHDIITAGVCICLAVIWKTNSLILLIAMLIYLIYDLVTEGNRRKKTACAIVFLIGLNLCATAGVKTVIKQITGTELSQGMPKSAWIAMGLQESGFAPGVWNGYSAGIFEDSNYIYTTADQEAKQKIKQQLKSFMDDKSHGLDFFGRKNAMQWNNPTFNCLEILEGRENSNADMLDNICHGPLKYKVIDFTNYLQSLILLGTCLYLYLMRKKQRPGELLFGLAVVGGMLFHLFWEAKAQYVLPYFLLILPYSAAGYSEMISRIYAVWEERKQDIRLMGKSCTIAAGKFFIVFALIGILSILSHFRLVSYTIGIQNEPVRLEQYYEAESMELEDYEKRQSNQH